MQASTFTLDVTDGQSLFVYRWMPEAPARATIQIVHGLAEHAARYARLAEALTGAGYAVYAHDWRGHGRTARTPAELGYFADFDGWGKCLDDAWMVNRRMAADQPGLPIFLIGHSMGSLLAQHFIEQHGGALAGCVLSASDGKPPAIAGVGRLIARFERLRLGKHGISGLINAMAFGAFNKPFGPARTEFDWLSRDAAEVDKYVADPLCGFPSTVQLWIDLLDVLPTIADPAAQARIPKHLPIYVIAGSRDPVSRNTAGLQQLLGAYKAAGLDRVQHRFYDGARHELFNETNRDEVTGDLLAWLGRVVAT